MTGAHIMTVLAHGRNVVPAFATVYPAEELHDVAAYFRADLVSGQEEQQ